VATLCKQSFFIFQEKRQGRIGLKIEADRRNLAEISKRAALNLSEISDRESHLKLARLLIELLKIKIDQGKERKSKRTRKVSFILPAVSN